MAEVTFIPTVVESCGTAADDVAATVSDLAGRFGSTVEFVDRHRGLASVDALKSCHTAWSGRIWQQGADASIVGMILHEAVREYAGADERNADDIRSTVRNRPI
jgi:hypothetical protein